MKPKNTFLNPLDIKNLGIYHGEKYLQSINKSIFDEPYFLEYINGFIKGFKELAEFSKEYQLICEKNKKINNLKNNNNETN